jgi:hypothetical protein
MESLRSFAPLDDRRGEGGRTGTAPRPGPCPSAPPCRPISVFEHCGGTVKTRNQCFSAALSGARPRRWKSEFLSTAPRCRGGEGCWCDWSHGRRAKLFQRVQCVLLPWRISMAPGAGSLKGWRPTRGTFCARWFANRTPAPHRPFRADLGTVVAQDSVAARA